MVGGIQKQLEVKNLGRRYRAFGNPRIPYSLKTPTNTAIRNKATSNSEGWLARSIKWRMEQKEQAIR
jgi:hypothetical protein